MGLVTKSITYAYSVQDGRNYIFKDQNQESYDQNFVKTSVYKYRIDNMILPTDKKDSSFLRYIGYIYYFPNIMCAPWICYNDYRTIVENSFKNQTFQHKITTVIQGFYLFISGISIHYLIFGYLDPILSVNPYYSLSGDYFREKSAIIKILLINYHGTLKRFIMYGSSFIENASIATTGIHYCDKQNKFIKNKQYDIINMEMDWDIGVKAGTYWNKQTHAFLFYNIYTRIFSYNEIKQSFLKKTIAQLITYNIQGFQHGCQPGFILFSSLGSLMAFISRALRSCFKNNKNQNNNIFKIIRWVIFSTWLNSLVCLFCLNEYESIQEFSVSINFLPYYVTLLGTIWMFSYKIYQKKIKQQNKQKYKKQ